METAQETIINVQELEPKLRHATIFQTFDELKEGESLIIHNNHDPQPVFYQLMDMRGNIFAWDYLQKGPEWWDIRVTKLVGNISGRIDEFILNVPGIKPESKHAAIFQVFKGTDAGESFIIHNDHDPKPVFYQLQNEFGDSFTWEYIHEGPQWWNVQITIKQVAPERDENGEIVINVPTIEPRLKHQTIFNTFDNLKPGEAFIIHNNHDPKPVFYQLNQMHGDVFTWEYLQEGPQWWDIRVTRKPLETNISNENHPSPKEITIDVPSLEPKLKHSTIFDTFDRLQPGESMIIHNDHDPKPVYYQLKSERGDIFTWEYLQQGPQWWDIRVTKNATVTQETIGEIVAGDIRKAEVFKKLGIDFCCNGKKTIQEACAAKGIDPAIVEAELCKPVEGTATANVNYTEWEPDFLADYIVNTHHRYVKKYLPEIRGYSIKVAQVHSNQHPELKEIKDLFENINEELTEHMLDEEGKLFPIIRQIVHAKNQNTRIVNETVEQYKTMTADAEKEHDSEGRAMENIRKLSQNFEIPPDACTSYKLLFRMLEEFENDLFVHIHLENNILFPKTEEILTTFG